MGDSDPVGSSISLQLLLLLALTAVNAFFAAAEMAIVSVNKNKINRLAEDNNKRAEMVQKLLKEPNKFLSTIQVAITLSGFFASGSAARGISNQLGALFLRLHIPYSTQISFILVTIILSYFTLVFGELIPKRIALQKSEVISLAIAKPVQITSKITAPFVRFLSFSTSIVLKMLGMHNEDLEERVSEEEIRSLIETGQENGVFNEYEKTMIELIFEFDDKLAREIMTSRTNVYAIDINEPITEYLDELLETRHSRIPVYDDEIDNISGSLYIKDFILEARKVGFENVKIRPILHKAYFVPESKKIDELFKELQASKQYIAILIDEYGGFSGIVTVEDLVEEVMGDIDDTGDQIEPFIEKIDNNNFILNGLVTIWDINDELDLDIMSENHDTISGLLIDMLGVIPDEGDNPIVKIDNMTFRIEEIKDKRIERIRLTVEEKKDESIEEEESDD